MRELTLKKFFKNTLNIYVSVDAFYHPTSFGAPPPITSLQAAQAQF